MATVDLLVVGASEVVTVDAGGRGPARGRAAMNDLRVVERGAVAIRGRRVVDVGPEATLARRHRAKRRIDVDGRTVLPGFVDAHTHPVFARWREDEFARRCRGASYEEILAAGGGILASAKALVASPQKALEARVRDLLDHVLLHGTTVLEAKSGYGLTADAEVRSLKAIRTAARGRPITVVPTFLGAHALPAEFAKNRAAYVRLVTDVMVPQVARGRLAVFCDVFCERGAFTARESATILKAARRHGLAGKIHADEFSDGGGAALAARMRAVSAEHLGATGPAGIRAMARAGVVPVLLPSTSVFLGLAEKPDARGMIEAGCAVALATDLNPGSSPTGNLALSASLGCTMLRMTPEEVVTAITRNAAAAVGLVGAYGRIAKGRPADLVVLDAPSYVHLPYRMGTNLVRTVVRHGEVVVREGRLVG
ncbi:MAG TPA: imidazolonepropionase [Planctomycetota bacterium]|nr:imidazolonepropionase [Planctomycetota bacterium]